MATSRQRRAAERVANQQAANDAAVNDSFENLMARTGVSSAAGNLSSYSSYTLNPITRQRQLLDMMYRGSWIVAVAVDCVADDMTRAGIDFSSNVDPDDSEKLQTAFQTYNIWGSLGDTIRWARLYGGCIAVLLIDGQNIESEFRIETVKKGQFKGLAVLDRWQLQPTFGPGQIIEEYGPDFGKPAWYRVVSDTNIAFGMTSPLYGKKIHHSRIIRFEGTPLPFYQRMAEMGWGMSIVERIYDRIIAFDSVTQGMSQLVYKAHLRTMKVEGLKQILAAGGKALDTLMRNVEQIRKFQSSEGLTLLDAKDEIENYSYTFTGLPEVTMQVGQQISGALQVPLVRLFGQSPAGLNSTGESDFRVYYDGVNKDQESMLRVPIKRICEIMYLSELGKEMPDDANFAFSPLWQKTDEEKADYAQKVTQAITQVEAAAIIGQSTALKELRKQSQISGIFTSITDEEIDAAEEMDKAPPLGMLQEQPDIALPGRKQGESAPKMVKAPLAVPEKAHPLQGRAAAEHLKGKTGQDEALDFDPHEARIPKGQEHGGRWTRGLGGEEIGGLVKRLHESGGFTYQPISGASPAPGEGALIVSPYSLRETVLIDAKPIDIARFVANNIDLLKKAGHFLGAWHNPDDGKTYLDVSIVTHNETTAKRLCKEHSQFAYYDLDKGATVNVEGRANG